MRARTSDGRGTCISFTREGTRWTARETQPCHLPPSERRACLIFECEAAVRRVYGYPANWMELSGDALWELSLGR